MTTTPGRANGFQRRAAEDAEDAEGGKVLMT